MNDQLRAAISTELDEWAARLRASDPVEAVHWLRELEDRALDMEVALVDELLDQGLRWRELAELLERDLGNTHRRYARRVARYRDQHASHPEKPLLPG